MRLHLDTDVGSNPDDACAIAMLLGWPDVEVAGITTTADADLPALDRLLRLLRASVPVASGRDPAACAELLHRGVDRGATVVAIGPYTNLALAESARPGLLAGVSVVAMGGWVRPLGPGYPSWGPGRDFNVQRDVAAASTLFASGARLTFVPCAAAVDATLRRRHLRRRGRRSGGQAVGASGRGTRGGSRVRRPRCPLGGAAR